MASQSEWKNPNEIMKTHRMQRHPSFNQAKSKSTPKIGISRRHSFTVLSQANNNSPSPRLRSSLCDTSIHVQETGSQKRKNPFGCDITSSLCKRRSVFSEDIPAENHELAASSQIVTSPCDASLQQSGSDTETETSTEIKPNRLLSALIMQEKKDLDELLLTSNDITDVNEPLRIGVNESLRIGVNESLRIDVETPLRIDGDLFVKHQPDVLKEKPATLNTAVPRKENKFGNNKVQLLTVAHNSVSHAQARPLPVALKSAQAHPQTVSHNSISHAQAHNSISHAQAHPLTVSHAQAHNSISHAQAYNSISHAQAHNSISHAQAHPPVSHNSVSHAQAHPLPVALNSCLPCSSPPPACCPQVCSSPAPNCFPQLCLPCSSPPPVSHNSVSHAQAHDSISHAQAHNSVSHAQAHNSVAQAHPLTVAHNSVAQAQAHNSISHAQAHNSVSHAQAHNSVSHAQAHNSVSHTQVCPSPPPDWSLKSKARVTVHTSVPSFKKHPGTDAKNVDSYVQHKLDNSPEWKDLDIVQQMKRCCMHYSYPHMPWLSTFPRLSSDFKSRSPSVITNSREVLESLQKDWSSAFTSIYQQLQGGLCPYFYVCAYQFSVLFRCQRALASTSWSALLSPSTRGLREILTKEGIPFRMPNIRSDRPGGGQKQKGNGSCGKNESEALPSSQTDQDTQDAADENSQKENTSREIADKCCKSGHDESSDEDIDGDDEASRWLEGMGLDRKDFPSLEPCKVKLQREGFREIDNRPQSLVYVEGVDVHSFFNFLLNYPSCIASSGPQHGIPPTILSPVSFVGGRLVQNMVKHTTLSDGLSHVGSQPDGSRNKCTHVFEISGPLLPHHSLNIASILHNSPECETSSVSFSTHAPSAAFNTQTQHNTEKDKLAVGLSKLFVDLSQANPGLLQDVRQQLLASPVLGAASAVREMYIQKSGYLWNC